MSSDHPIKWNNYTRRLESDDGVLRATQEVVTRWCKQPPKGTAIMYHESNPRHVGLLKWWAAQAAHYGIDPETNGNKKPVQKLRRRFKKQLNSGPLEVPPHIHDLEEQLRRDVEAESIKDEEPSGNGVHVHSEGSGWMPVDAEPVQQPSQTWHNSTLPNPAADTSRLSLKRKATSDFEQQPSRQASSPRSVFRSRAWPSQEDSRPDPFLLRSSNSAEPNGGHSVIESRIHNDVLITMHRNMQESNQPASESTVNPDDNNDAMNAVPNSDDASKEDVEEEVLEATSEMSESETAGYDGKHDEESMDELEEDSQTSYEAKDEPSQLTDAMATTISQHIDAVTPTKQAGSPNVTFYYTKKDGWSVACRCFTFSENRGFLIYGHPKSTSTKWQDHLSRASRWQANDHNMNFYYSQLLHRGLPSTKFKEVAKWRLKSRTQVSKRALSGLDMIKTKLFICLSHNIEDMKSGKLGPSLNKISFTESKDGEIQPWMVEEPGKSQGAKSAYELIMSKWLYLRSRYVLPPTPHLPPKPAPVPRDPDALVPPRCRVCDRKYRLCICDFCDACAELEDDCDCEKCNTCRFRIEFCTCEPCAECKMKYNVGRKIYCHCFCPECGVKYSFDCLSPLNTDDQFIGLGSTLCDCELSWPQARELGHRRKKEREDRQIALARAGVDKASTLHTVQWIQDNVPGYFDEDGRLAPDRSLCLSDICGTYELVLDDRVTPTDQSELLISSDCKSLHGRFRFRDQLHGLFRTKRIPSQASTEPVQCQVAVQHPDGAWQFDILNQGRDSAAVEGILFLGNGLIVLDSRCFSSRSGVSLNSPIFGIKVCQECEDMDALRDSWYAVHDSVCGCTFIAPQADGDINPLLHSAWKTVDEEAGETKWDEGYIDRLIDRLRPATINGRGSPPVPSVSPAPATT